jgi:hypothetical protein
VAVNLSFAQAAELLVDTQDPHIDWPSHEVLHIGQSRPVSTGEKPPQQKLRRAWIIAMVAHGLRCDRIWEVCLHAHFEDLLHWISLLHIVYLIQACKASQTG